MQIHTVKSLEEFTQVIMDLENKNREKYPESKLIFRGQSNVDWNIASSAYRFIYESYPTIKITPVIMETFKERVQYDMEELKQIDKEIMNLHGDDETMCMLQHMGGKSTFIDFSENPQVALYFACEKYHDDKDGIVFIMRHQGNDIYNRKHAVGTYKHVVPDKNNPAYTRVRVQNSCFLKPTDDGLILNDENITKIIIDKKCKADILQSLEPGINRKAVYPDIWGYIGSQKYYTLDTHYSHQSEQRNKHINTLKSIVFRETSQLIKDGTMRRMDDVFKTLDNLNKLNGLLQEDFLRIKCLKVRALMCATNYDEALLILETIREPYLVFTPVDDYNATRSEQFDAIEPYFIRDLEIAQCYMGKEEYEIAQEYYDSSRQLLNEINCEESLRKKLKDTIYKQQAISLVKGNKYNLSIALDMLSELGNNKTNLPDKAGLYIIAERWEEAIRLLKSAQDDYALNLLAQCYMALSKRGDKRLYLSKAIETYQRALSALKSKQTSERYYRQKTEDHDHHFIVKKK